MPGFLLAIIQFQWYQICVKHYTKRIKQTFNQRLCKLLVIMAFIWLKHLLRPLLKRYEKTLDISSDREWMCRSVWCVDKKEESSNGMLRSTMTHVLKDLCVLSRPDSKSSLGSSDQATFCGHFHLVRKRISILVNLYDGRNSISR